MNFLGKWEAIAVMVLILAIGAYNITNLFLNKEIAIEAIKAGLVQDSNRHWVKPPALDSRNSK